MTAGLPEALRHGTRALHTEVERSDFMRVLLRGQMERAAYLQLLRNLHALYDSLESALVTCREHPLLALLHDARLFRTPALARDLETLHGPGWSGAIGIQPACETYRTRLQNLARSAPELLVAHAYVRYLGDLSGGQQLKRIVSRSLGLPEGTTEGIAFYDFGDEAQTAALTGSFRERLARLPAGTRDIAGIVAEAQDAFGRHRQLFEQLASACLPRTGQDAFRNS